jgi:hypothetical protein
MHVAIAIVIVLFLPYIVGFLNHNEYHKTANKIESIANGVYDLADILLNSFGVASKKNTIPNESISNSLNWAEQQDKPRMSAAQIKAQQDRQRKLEEQQALRDRINREKVESCITRVETQSDINKREMSNIDDYTFIGSSSTGWGFNIDGESFYIDLHNKQYGVNLYASSIFAQSNPHYGDLDADSTAICPTQENVHAIMRGKGDYQKINKRYWKDTFCKSQYIKTSLNPWQAFSFIAGGEYFAVWDSERVKQSVIKYSLLDKAINADKQSKINMCKKR